MEDLLLEDQGVGRSRTLARSLDHLAPGPHHPQAPLLGPPRSRSCEGLLAPRGPSPRLNQSLSEPDGGRERGRRARLGKLMEQAGQALPWGHRWAAVRSHGGLRRPPCPCSWEELSQGLVCLGGVSMFRLGGIIWAGLHVSRSLIPTV